MSSIVHSRKVEKREYRVIDLMEQQGYERSLWLEWTGFDANGTRAVRRAMALLKSSSLFLTFASMTWKHQLYILLSNAQSVPGGYELVFMQHSSVYQNKC